jgi:hypothetical protein
VVAPSSTVNCAMKWASFVVLVIDMSTARPA